MILVSIDPGLRACGCAAWHDSQLIDAHFVQGEPHGVTRVDLVEATSYAVEEWLRVLRQRYRDSPVHVIIEEPQTYGGRAKKGDANDLIGLAMVVGAIGARLGEPWETVRPAEWKGQVPKKTVHGTNPIELRCRGKFYTKKTCLVHLPRRKDLQHNVWDAIGIGMWHLDR